MAFKDALLHLSSYPEATPVEVIDAAVGFAAALGVHLSALTFNIDIPRPGAALANSLLDIRGMVAAERQKSATNVHDLMRAFGSVATRCGVPHDEIVETAATSQIASIIADHARFYDLTIIPVGGESDLQHYVAECVIFESGRPVIVLPEVPKRRGAPLDVIGVAWDFSRPAARAVADALPILQRAGSVRVVTVEQEKSIETRRSFSDLARHLGRHGVEVVLDVEMAAGRSIGQSLEHYAIAHDLSLLVMGAYAHSRLRDLILGGATKTIVANPPVPVLLSH